MDTTVEVTGVKFDSGNAVITAKVAVGRKQMLEMVDWLESELPHLLTGQTKLAKK